MNKEELIARVATRYLKGQLDAEPHGALRFCMIGLDPLASTIAAQVLADPELAPLVEVKIPEPIADPSKLPAEAITTQAAAHWRNTPLSPGYRAILFAASNDELQRIGKTAETLPKLETDRLRGLYEEWLEETGLGGEQLQGDERASLTAALQAVNETHVARTLEAFADYVRQAAEQIHSGKPVPQALDAALPALQLPRNGGALGQISSQKQKSVGEWRKRFRRLYKDLRPLLVRENSKGERIDEQIDANLKELQESLEPEEIEAVRAFREADVSPGRWTEEQQALVRCDWQRIKGIFEGARQQQSTLGEATIRLFDNEYSGELEEKDREYLEKALSPAPKNPPEEAVEFYERHGERIAQERGLQRQWERFIFRNPKTYNDFLIGLLATLHRLREAATDAEMSSSPRLYVRIPGSDKLSFWTQKNRRVMRYFAQRYHGLAKALGDRVELDFGKMNELYLPEPDQRTEKATRESKEARSLKFEVIFDPEGATEKMLFYWMMPAQALATAMPEDLHRLLRGQGQRALLAKAKVTRQAVSAKGRIQRISLEEQNTLRDVENGNEGALVAPNLERDLYDDLTEEIGNLAQRGVIGEQQRSAVEEALERFQEAYTQALRDWTTPNGAGISSEAFTRQAHAYGDLLSTLVAQCPSGACREQLWVRALCIGVANIGGGSHAALITPWQPLRLAELHVKAVQTGRLITQVLDGSDEAVTRADLFFSQRQKELGTNYYPEVCLGFSNSRKCLLTVTQSSYGYSLAELPYHSTEGAESALDVAPEDAAKAFAAIGEQYLNLLPHKKVNFSAALYNSDSKALPKAIAEALSRQIEQEESLRCNLMLTHCNPASMRRIYEQQNVAVSENSSAAPASEAANSFLSRLRVSFLEPGEIRHVAEEEERPLDLVMLQDVVSRNATITWKPTPSKAQPLLLEHIPVSWSRRRPVALGETASAVYLTAPVQPAPCQAYLNALEGVVEQREVGYQNLVPAREINYQDTEVGQLFKETHQLGEWVVNFDELVDRRLLHQQDIRIIRHLHDRSLDRNIVVSTTSEPRLLLVLLKQRIGGIDPEMEEEVQETTSRALIREANRLSGQIVMRAARFGRYANELIGVVLSMQRIKATLEIDDSRHVGWFFMDDFASWLGQKEEQIADIMAIAPHIKGGQPVLRIAITEAKLVSAQGHQAHMKTSARQLSETIKRISRALDPKQQRIDRQVWLNRIGDLMIEGMEPFNDQPINGWGLQEWSEQVRHDQVPIELVGFSHVFIHDDTAAVDSGDAVPLQRLEHCCQIVVDRAGVQEELRRFAAGLEPSRDSTRLQESWSGALVSHSPAPAEEMTRAKTDGEGEDLSSDESSTPASDLSAGSQEHGREQAEPVPSGAYKAAEPRVAPLWPSVELRDWVHGGSLDSFATEADWEWVETTEKSLKRALRGYGMSAELTGSTLTPNAAIIRFKGSDDLTIQKVENKLSELYTSHGINIVNVLPEPGMVAVMVKRKRRAQLRMRDLWRKRELPATAPLHNASLLLGAKEADGNLIYLNLAEEFAGYSEHGPHTLIAGESGSGKGVLVQNLLLDICATNAPSRARIRLIDPKAGIDYPWVRQMPHLDGEVITEQERAITAMEELVTEMERRNRLISENGASKISQYNQRVSTEEQLPLIFLFHDELANWMLIREYREAVERNVVRLGTMARAAGIHLFLITQRPDKDALPLQLRANCSNRLILKVADKRNSELALDQAGAERLLGRGHLAAKLSGEGDPILVQVPFADEDETAKLAQKICRAWQQSCNSD